MSTFLRKKQAESDYNPRTWVWLKNCWKPVKNYRFIKRGKKRGWVEVELFYPENKFVTIPVTSMKFASVTTGQGVHKNNEESAK